MRNKYPFYILLFVLPFFAVNAFSQAGLENLPNVKVSQFSDAQITGLWEKASDQGLSEKEIYALLIERGMKPGEVEELKNRVTLLGLNAKKGSEKDAILKSAASKIDYSRTKDDTVLTPNLLKDIKPKDPNKLKIYGMELFQQVDLTFEPNFSTATPQNYVLGPGDQVIVLLTGLNEKVTQSVITPEGNLLLEHVEPIHVNGFTIEQATAFAKAKMARVYPAITTGKTKVSVNLGNTRRIKVMVTGEVNTPGGFTISSLATLFNVLYHAGGPNENGSLRNIRLIRNNRVLKTLDFYEFLQNGIMADNIRLEDQDVISIPVYKKRVGIKGAVKRPALFEMKDNETLTDLIRYAGGFTPDAYQGMAKVDQIVELERQLKDVPANTFANYIPQNGDMVNIDEVSNRYTNRIVLEGSVYQPGPYELTAGLTLSQLLKNAQGLKPEAYMERGYIKRTMPDLEKRSISFDPRAIIAGKDDIPLMREDSVVVLNQDAFISDQKIWVSGFVRKPLTITYRKGIKLGDALAIAGGFSDDAAVHRIEISRIIKNESDIVSAKVVETYLVNMNDPTDPNRELELQPRDAINVMRLPNYGPLGIVKVRGEVVFPSDYSVERRDETAREFVARAGGITPFGSLENAQIFRNGVRINVDLVSPSTTYILLPGDSIYVPRVPSYVEVAGAVNNPQFVTYKSKNFKYYIDAAAGTTQNARLKGAYIKYPNGLNKPVRNVLFFKSYPVVKPGSKIIVPNKNPDARIRIGVGEIGGIAAIMSALVSMVAILSR